jgi:isopentenyl phosphate kinase
VPRGVRVEGTGQGADVTGRMEGKLRHARACARAAPTFILGPDDLPAALRGKPAGSRVLP